MPASVSSTAKLFANDTKLYREIVNARDFQMLQEDLNTLPAWFKPWFLLFHETDCVVLKIRKCFDSLNGIQLAEGVCQRERGVIISNDLYSQVFIFPTW